MGGPPVLGHKESQPMTRTAALALFLSSFALAQPAPRQQQLTNNTPERPLSPLPPVPTSPEDEYLAERFTTMAGGISLRPPQGATAIRPRSVGSTIAQFVNKDENWSLNVSRLFLDKPARLAGVDDPRTELVDESQTQPGLVSETARRLARQSAGRLLRADVVNVGPHDVGLIALRYTQGNQSWLRQQAILRADGYGDRLFYVLDLTTPSTASINEQDDVEDPTEATAVTIFRAVLDSVQLIDQRPIEKDNAERLFRTRTFLVGLADRARDAIKSEQYFRIQQNGKDIGWSFVAEELGERHGRRGIFAATLTHMQPDPANRTQRGHEMFASDDRQTEAWGALTISEADGPRTTASEFGQSERKVTRSIDPNQSDPNDPSQPKLNVSEHNVLRVTQILPNQLGSTPVERQLPPYYLPQATSHLLPRLMPLNRPSTYLFAVWSAPDRELVYRYIDVEAARPGKFNNQTGTFVIVRDRLGLEGDPTLHYFTPAGQYLGSHTPTTNLTFLTTDQPTLTKLYPDAKLIKPRLLDTAPSK
jgi:hypothetical protein